MQHLLQNLAPFLARYVQDLARWCKNRARKGTYRVHVPCKSCMQDSCTILQESCMILQVRFCWGGSFRFGSGQKRATFPTVNAVSGLVDKYSSCLIHSLINAITIFHLLDELCICVDWGAITIFHLLDELCICVDWGPGWLRMFHSKFLQQLFRVGCVN